jgi:hypothetical protein
MIGEVMMERRRQPVRISAVPARTYRCLMRSMETADLTAESDRGRTVPSIDRDKHFGSPSKETLECPLQ